MPDGGAQIHAEVPRRRVTLQHNGAITTTVIPHGYAWRGKGNLVQTPPLTAHTGNAHDAITVA